MKTLTRTLQLYVDHMARENRPLLFTEIVAVTLGVNKFRTLIQRSLVENVVPGYQPGETYDGPRMPKYVLTPKARSCVSDRTTPESQPDELAATTDQTPQ